MTGVMARRITIQKSPKSLVGLGRHKPISVGSEASPPSLPARMLNLRAWQ